YQDFDWRRIDVLHLIPYGVAFLSTILGYHLKSQTEKLAWLNGLADAEAAENLAVSLVVLVGIGAYLFAAFRHLRRYRERLQEDYAELERKNLGWLRRLLLTFAGLSVLSVLSQVLNFIDGESQWMMLSLLLTVLFLVGQILYTVYIGMRESLLFGGISEATTDRETTPQAKLPEGVAVRRAERIKDYFATDHPYLDPELSLASLAAALDLPEREVSQSINGVLGQHFFDLVNAYRIDHACALLDNPKDKGETILEVMYASGFQSKSSFNTEFRRRTGMTPSGWKKRGSVVGN
ncbi:MAG: helix-turn-helix domain-containing protein, partial [Bacteroidota bacterium]